MSVDHVEVAVIGGGIMGAATAWHLGARGISTVLVERFEPAHTRGASHGASRNFNVSYDQPEPLAWLREADALWQDLEAQVREPVLDRTGIINHGPGRDWAAVAAAVGAGGFDTEVVDALEAARRWPGFRFETEVLLTPQAGRLRADRALAGFVAGAEASGVEAVFRSAVVAGSIDDRGVLLHIRSDDGTEREVRARRVVVTAGAWTEPVLASIGATIALPTLRITQEQPAHFATLSIPDADWPGFNHAPSADDPATAWFPTGVYGMGTPGQGLKAGWHAAGPVVDPDRRSFVPEPALSASLREYARQWLPGVDADAATEVTCTYTSTPTSAFVLNRVGPVVVGAGFSGHGFKFAPVIGRILTDLALRD